MTIEEYKLLRNISYQVTKLADTTDVKREYKIVDFSHKDTDQDLNELWEQGWELVTGFHYNTNLFLWNYLIFKRPKK